MVLKAIEIINHLKPKFWFIENPRGKLRDLWFMKKLPRKTVTYCQYGMEVRKETDIWTNSLAWTPKPKCKKGDRCHKDFRRLGEDEGGIKQMRGWTFEDRAKRAIVPKALCEEIYISCLTGKNKQRTLVENGIDGF